MGRKLEGRFHGPVVRSEEHTSELQSLRHLVCRLLLEKKNKRVIRSGIKANRYMRENRDGTIPMLMSTYRLDKEVASEADDSFIKEFNHDGKMPDDGFRHAIDDTKRILKIDRDVALSEVSDFAILREAQRELGIKGK